MAAPTATTAVVPYTPGPRQATTERPEIEGDAKPGVSTFRFGDRDIRVVDLNGNPWFLAVDVRRTLGITQGGNNYTNLRADEVQIIPRGLITGKGMSQAQLLSESGLYKFVMRSDKPEAKAFQDWVTREVLPSIRKTGSYSVSSAPAVVIDRTVAEVDVEATFIDLVRRRLNASQARSAVVLLAWLEEALTPDN